MALIWFVRDGKLMGLAWISTVAVGTILLAAVQTSNRCFNTGLFTLLIFVSIFQSHPTVFERKVLV
jgi:uncharacterized membrane protein YccF (DUF307 family)